MNKNNSELEKEGTLVNINPKLMEELNKLKNINVELEKKILTLQNKTREGREGESSLEQINTELSLRLKELKHDLESQIKKNTETIIDFKKTIEEKEKLQKIISDHQKEYYNTLRSIKREKEIIKEEEIVDVCKRLISIKETILKFQENNFPGYMDSLNLINYLKEEVERFLMIKNVEEVFVDFRELNLDEVIILDKSSIENKIIKTGYVLGSKMIYPAEVVVSPDYLWLTRASATLDRDQLLFDRHLKSVIDESLNVEKELFISLDQHFINLENKHLLTLSDYFKNFFRLYLLKLIEERPEISFLRLSYRKIINRVTEEFRKVLEYIPSYDLIRATRREIIEQEKEVIIAFENWKKCSEEELEGIREITNKYLKLSLIDKKDSDTLLKNILGPLKLKQPKKSY